MARTARALAALSLEAADGAYLGSENELVARLGVSRPTLRQAAKVVENDSLLSVRRGVNGGFYAARPDARHVVQAPALWLHLQHASMTQMSRASRLIFPAAVVEAAACRDPALRADLAAFRGTLDQRLAGREPARETVRSEVAFSRLIGRMTGDPVLMLFIDISYAFGLLEQRLDLYGDAADRRRQWLELQAELCDAILAGRGEQARRLSDRRGSLIAQWIDGPDGKDAAATA